MTPKQKLELETYDERRKERLYLLNELSDLKYWLEDGYKNCDGKTLAIEMIMERMNEYKADAEKIFEVIISKRKGWGV
jgi:hypothetical protein